jgi:hypothetical protein
VQRGRNGSATGNAKLWIFWGWSESRVIIFNYDRIDYSNDTATASVRGPLSQQDMVSRQPHQLIRWRADFTPTQQFFDIQSMRRIEDTTSASVKKRVLGSYGYFGGGTSPSSAVSTDRSYRLL